MTEGSLTPSLLGLFLQSQDVWSLDRQLSLVRSDNDWASFQMFNFAELCLAFADSFKSRYWRTSRQALHRGVMGSRWGNPAPSMARVLSAPRTRPFLPPCKKDTLKWFLKQPHIPRGMAVRTSCQRVKTSVLGILEQSDLKQVKMFEFSSLHFPLVVLLFLFIYREINSIMGNSKANGKHFSWVCLSWQHNNNCNNLTTALGASESESSLHS